jgi:hypothetical protein
MLSCPQLDRHALGSKASFCVAVSLGPARGLEIGDPKNSTEPNGSIDISAKLAIMQHLALLRQT